MELCHALRLIVITDEVAARPHTILDRVEAALRGGARAVQLRDKGASARRLLDQAHALRILTDRFGALLFINDRLDIALAAKADGVHLGPLDLPVDAARRAAPANMVIGYSTDDPAEARTAVSAGADYIGCGAVYETAHKHDAGDTIGIRGLEAVVHAVPVPVVGIGGIGPGTASEVRSTGACGIAVIGAIMSASDPEATAQGLLGD